MKKGENRAFFRDLREFLDGYIAGRVFRELARGFGGWTQVDNRGCSGNLDRVKKNLKINVYLRSFTLLTFV